ncbi:hypothetical protein AAG570_009220 [Ranatra chinensis]|uniref:Small ribosomal subunit protein bS6m n=1 Tax=Ranatra chinensis TaxID=642074 RepID=A0ABD0YT35_9HEMI
MPSYELTLLLKILPKNELAVILKRAASAIFNTGGIIRRIDNLGSRSTPYKTSSHGFVHKEASYFVIEFDAPPAKLDSLLEEYNRDVDIIRNRIFKTNDESSFECTIDQESKPAPYRSEIIKMLEEVKKKAARQRKYKYNCGLDYYPFQK